jgi:hypothetical protein
MGGDTVADWGKGWSEENSITAIKEFFDTEDMPLKPKEFQEFWMSLSDDEKREYRQAQLGPE